MIQAIRAGLAVASRRLPCARLLRRFARREDGIAAVEFGIVAAPFLALMFAIIETALVFFAGQTLETAVADSARLIMTGQAQMSNMSASAFKSQICARLSSLMDCANGLDVDVSSYSSFASVNITNPIVNGNYSNTTGYNAGHAGDIVVVRTFYQWPTFVTGLGYDPSNLNNKKRLITSTAAFRNEPGPF